MSKIFTVFGATGNQGGSVIRAVLADPVLSKEYKLRGVTRDVSKPAAQALSAKGVEMVKVSWLPPVMCWTRRMSADRRDAGRHVLS
jgi:uncharacterized protein YbjT (DUF2867 family)